MLKRLANASSQQTLIQKEDNKGGFFSWTMLQQLACYSTTNWKTHEYSYLNSWSISDQLKTAVLLILLKQNVIFKKDLSRNLALYHFNLETTLLQSIKPILIALSSLLMQFNIILLVPSTFCILLIKNFCNEEIYFTSLVA